jgi:protein-S-isoprenylcysteine O-methyltransferase Ste14
LAVVVTQLQVRLVEEPYLNKVHGESDRQYASTVGRFVPRAGLIR